MVSIHIVDTIVDIAKNPGKIVGVHYLDEELSWNPDGLAGFKQVAEILGNQEVAAYIDVDIDYDNVRLYKITSAQKFLQACDRLLNQHLWPRLAELSIDHWIEVSW